MTKETQTQPAVAILFDWDLGVVTRWLAGCLLVAAAGLIAARVLARTRHTPTGLNARKLPEATADPSELEKLAFIRNRIIEHRDKYLSYLTYMDGIRRRLHSSVIEKALHGREPVLADPVLYLYSDDWFWSPGQLNLGVDSVLAELALPASIERDATTRASEACRSWALIEASKLIDTALAVDKNQETSDLEGITKI